MKIQVNQVFSRRRVMGSEKILPGVYETNDPALFGLADELVELGFAVIVELPHAADEPPLPEITEDVATEERPSQPKRNAKRK